MDMHKFIKWVMECTERNEKISEHALITYIALNLRVGKKETEFIFWVIRETASTGQISKEELDKKLKELKLD